jgi:HK97 family phage portal protein
LEQQKLTIAQKIGLKLLGYNTPLQKAKSGNNKMLGPFAPLISTYQNNKPIWNSWDFDNAVKDGYKTCAWVYACENKKAKAVSSVPWKAKQTTKNGGLKELPGHELELLMSKPNPFIDGSDMIERMVYHLGFGGNALLQKVKVQGKPKELWPLGPTGVKPVPNREKFISHYEYYIGGKKEANIEPTDIIHAMHIDPSNLYWGMAPILAAAYAVDTDIEGMDWQKVSLQNRAVTDGVFSFKEPITPDQHADALAKIKAKPAREPFVLGYGATWQQMGMTPVEMDFIESRKFTLMQICAVEGVPQILIIYDDPSLNNIREAKKVFWEDTLIPLLDDLKSCFNNSLAPEFGDNIILDYDISGVEALRDTFDKKVETGKTLWSMGVPFEQINSKLELGFEEFEGWDRSYLPMGLLPADSIGMEDEDEPLIDDGINPDDEDEGNSNNPGEDDSLENREGEDGEGNEVDNKPPKKKSYKAFNLQTEEQKTLFWKAYDRERLGFENAIAKRVAKQFASEGQAVISAYKSGGVDKAEKAITKQRKNWTRLLKAAYAAVIEHFGERIASQLESVAPAKGTGPSEMKFEFDPFSAELLNWIRRQAGLKIKGIEQTTVEKVRDAIAEGEDANESTPQIAKRVKETYQDFGRYRSFVIARTETGAAAGVASQEAAKQTGMNLKKVWISSRDGRVRDSHILIDGEVKEMDEPYSNGCKFPGDPDGPAEEVIQCRCTESYEVVK